MKSLYDIIKSLQTTQGSKAKQAILDENWNNELLREYMKAMNDPAINFYTTKVPKSAVVGVHDLSVKSVIEPLLTYHASRKITGKAAKYGLKCLFESLNSEGQELFTYLIKRKIDKANVGETMVLKTWPGLFFVAPYQRCSLLNDKTRKTFENLQYFYCQQKCDGAFGYGIVDEAGKKEIMTRAGSIYPEWFAEMILFGARPRNVFVGELLVSDETGLLNRQTGNGVLNSILQSGDESEFKKYTFEMIAWDLLPLHDWELGACDEPYCDRLGRLEIMLNKEDVPVQNDIPNIKLVYYEVVTSMQQAFEIYQDHLARGEEGCIIKHPLSIWKDGTAKDLVKLKLKFQVDLEIIGYYEGTGKAAGMLGGLELATSDGLLKTDCGSGFDDHTRQLLWHTRDQLIGKVVTVEANDVGTKRGSDVKSLFLPVFIEIREDKRKADTLVRVMEQLESAKRGEL